MVFRFFRNTLTRSVCSSNCGSPCQYSADQSSSCQSPYSSPTGPWWNQVLVRMGGEKWRSLTSAKRRVPPCSPVCCTLECLRVELLHHAKAAELALSAVPVAVVIAVFRGQLAREISSITSTRATTCTGKGSGVFQRVSGASASSQIIACGRRVLHLGDRPHVVVHLIQQIWLYAAGQIQEEQLRRGRSRWRPGSTARR